MVKGVHELLNHKSFSLLIRLRPERVLSRVLIILTFIASFSLSYHIAGSFADQEELYAESTSCTFTKVETAAHQATLSPGTATEDIGTTKIVTKCPNSLDHQVYAVGYSNETTGNTNLENANSSATIPTGTTSGNVSNWSMKISKDNSSYLPENLSISGNYDSYSEIPSTPSMIANYSGGTDSETGSAITTTYRVSTAADQVAGDYLGTVKFTLTATMLYNITIAPTSGISKVTLNNVECALKTGCLVENLTSGQSYTLTATLEDGYTFVRWNPGKEGTVASPTTASTTYTVGDGNSFISPIAEMGTRTVQIKYGEGIASTTVNGTTVANNGTVNLANNAPLVINPVLNTGYALIGYTFTPISATSSTLEANARQTIQNLKHSECTTTPKQVYDVRDGQTYTIQRLADGNCWMMENLDLGRTELTVDLNSSNTNINETVAASTFNSWKKTAGSGTNDAGEFINLSGTDTMSNTKYGTLYNYYAASGGSVSGRITNNTSYDICPAGWRLPTGGTTGDFQKLYDEYNSYTLMRNSVANGGAAFALSGNFANDIPSTGSLGSYWSSTKNGEYSTMIQLSLQSSTETVYTNGTMLRKYGLAIRCILKKQNHAVTIRYDNNISGITIDGDTISNGQTILLDEGSVHAISATAANGYVFTGWETVSGEYEQFNIPTTTYTVGTNQDTITATAVPESDIIQNISTSDCTSTASTKYDSRDMQTYKIKRLNDGNCWMMENLNLGAVPLTGDLTANNTDTNTTITKSSFEGWKKNQYGLSYDAGEYIVQSGTDATSDNRYGTLYNYYAASAGKISGSTNAENAYHDICPAGWRLPTNTEYSTLYQNYHSLELMRKPESEGGAAFAYAGRISASGNVEVVGESGSYWSSVRTSDTEMRYMFISAGGNQVYPGDPMERRRGISIRCIHAEKSISDLTYLQDFRNLAYADIISVRSSMTDNTNYNLTDNRDSKSYNIAKLLDGNIWLTENLDLGRTSLLVNLTSDNTNINSTITASTFNGWLNQIVTTNDAGSFAPLTGTDSMSNTQYGTTYNYFTLSGGTITGQNSSNSIAENDICPAGWRLPTAGAVSEYATMFSFYNTNDLVRKPVSDGGAAFALAGRWSSGTHSQATQYGYYWSAINRNGSATNFRVYSGGVNLNNSTMMRTNMSARCIVKRIVEPTVPPE